MKRVTRGIELLQRSTDSLAERWSRRGKSGAARFHRNELVFVFVPSKCVSLFMRFVVSWVKRNANTEMERKFNSQSKMKLLRGDIIFFLGNVVWSYIKLNGRYGPRLIGNAVIPTRSSVMTILRLRVYTFVLHGYHHDAAHVHSSYALIGAKNSLSLIERDNRYKLNIAVKWQQVR